MATKIQSKMDYTADSFKKKNADILRNMLVYFPSPK